MLGASKTNQCDCRIHTLFIDAHQHFWQRSLPFDYTWLEAPQLARINRDYLPENLAPHLNAAKIDYSVFVQTQHNVEENRWALGLARQNHFLAGVVGWVDLASPNARSNCWNFEMTPVSSVSGTSPRMSRTTTSLSATM